MTRWRRGLAWVGIGTMLTLVFASYLRPDLMVSLANQLWACF